MGIVSCGQVDRKTPNQSDPSLVMGKAIANLSEEVAPTEKVRESTKANAILAGKIGGAKINDATLASSGKDDGDEEENESAALRPPRNERERKLFELRLRMNQSRNANNKEVVEEQKRNNDPDYTKKKAEERHKKAMEKEENPDGKDDLLKASSSKRGRANDLPEGKAYMNDTVEIAEMKDAKKKKGNPDAF